MARKKCKEMHSIHNEEKCVVPERFIRTLKNKIYKYIISRSKNMFIGKLDNIVTKYNNAYHRTIKMKPVNVKRNIYIDLRKKITRKVLNLMLVKMLEYENIKVYENKNIYENIFFQKAMFQIGLMKYFWLKKIKSDVARTFVIIDLNGEEIVWTFYRKELQEANQKGFRVEKAIKRIDDKVYVKYKGYDSSFNSWIKKQNLNEWILSITKILRRKSESWIRLPYFCNESRF